MTDTHPTDGPVHGWFSLSYGTYVVLPRTLMQSMPVAWQDRMVACLDEMRDAFEHIRQPAGYRVDAVYYKDASDLTDGEAALAQVAIDKSDDEKRSYFLRGEEIDACTTVAIPIGDPIPHYNRGRTYIPPRVSPDAA